MWHLGPRRASQCRYYGWNTRRRVSREHPDLSAPTLPSSRATSPGRRSPRAVPFTNRWCSPLPPITATWKGLLPAVWGRRDAPRFPLRAGRRAPVALRPPQPPSLLKLFSPGDLHAPEERSLIYAISSTALTRLADHPLRPGAREVYELPLPEGAALNKLDALEGGVDRGTFIVGYGKLQYDPDAWQGEAADVQPVRLKDRVLVELSANAEAKPYIPTGPDTFASYDLSGHDESPLIQVQPGDPPGAAAGGGSRLNPGLCPSACTFTARPGNTCRRATAIRRSTRMDSRIILASHQRAEPVQLTSPASAGQPAPGPGICGCLSRLRGASHARQL